MLRFVLLLMAIGLISCTGDKKKEAAFNVNPVQLMDQAKGVFGVIPDKMPGAEKDSPDMIALGEKLYFDVRLSINDQQSCNSCHPVDGNKFGMDQKPVSEGTKGGPGNRNSPTVLNAGFHFAQFWDGRAGTLEEQAKGPVLNPVEMGMPNGGAVEKKLRDVKEYQELFARVFPGKNPVTYDHMATAIAAFERTLRTTDRFDDFQKGNVAALTNEELGGLDLFIKTGCITCHTGPLLGGNLYQKTGLVYAYENTKDQGRYDVTKNEADRMLFKVPSMRNVAMTGPYLHDGAVATLDSAVAKMAWMQLGKSLTPVEIKAISAFLGSMTDKKRGASAM